MTRTTAIIQDGILLYQQHDVSRTLVVGTAAWDAWVVSATSFAFEHKHGRFTVRKERASNRRGGWYWRAYYKYQGTLYRTYIGKAENLTLAQLNEVAQAFSHHTHSTDRAENIPINKWADSFLEEASLYAHQLLRTPSPDALPHDALLYTKLSIPPVNAQVLPRPRLYQRLQQVRMYQLTLVSASAGFGKTTLLSAWYAASRGTPMPLAWLSLDESDNAPIRFWTYIIAALETLQPGIGADSLALLHSSQLPPIEAILTTLLNDVTTIPNDFVLILDDYHKIAVQPIHSAVEFLLDHLPAKMHLVIASRTTPPFRMARLRANGQLHELSTADLRFTSDEAAAFLNEMLHLHLSEQVLARLEARIEGWIAGLQLVALSLREQEDISGFVATFTGSHRYIIDYLVEEVLHRQAEQVQCFLLQTSIVEHLDASLCDALTCTANGQNMLTLLDQENLFIVPLDHERKWYRYHALFADVLCTQLQQVHPYWIPELHLKASRWYEEHGFLVEAIDHALAAADFEQAATLIEQVAQTTTTIWVQREYTMLQRWLDRLPQAFLRSRMQLCILHAWVLFSSIQRDSTVGLEVVETRLREAESGLQLHDGGSQTQAMRGEIAVLFAALSFLKGDITQTATRALLALELLPKHHTTLRGVAARTLVNAYSLSGDTAAASRALGELMSICHATNDIYAMLNALCNLAQLQALQGHLHQAAATYQQAIQLAEQTLKQITPSSAYIGLSILLLEWNDIEAAAHSLMKGIEQCKKGGDPGIVLSGYVMLTKLKQAQGNIDEAFRAIEEAERIIQKYQILSQQNLGKAYMAALEAFRAQLHLSQGNIEAANRWAQTCQPAENERNILPRVRELSILARIYLATQKFEDALKLLARLLQEVEKAQHVEDLITIFLLQALTFSAQGNSEQAITALAKALSIAEPGGYRRIFVNEGRPMEALLERFLVAQQKGRPLITKNISQRYVSQLLAGMPMTLLAQTEKTSQKKAASLLVPLSERESAVLHLIAVGLSDREIARQLVLAVGTIKTHAKRIYAKLGVNNRTQAVLRAKELHLL